MQVLQRSINGDKVFLDNGIALLAVSLFNRVLNLGDCFVFRQDVGDGKETCLHNGINAHAHTGLAGNFYGINGVELEFLVDDFFLDFNRKMIPNFICAVRSVEQESCTRFGNLQNVYFRHEGKLVAGNKICFADQISRFNRVIGETQVRGGHGAGFARIVNKIALAVFAGVFSNDFDGIFIGTDRTVSTQAEEHGADNVFGFGVNRIVIRQRCFVNIIVDADGEAVNRFGGSAVVVNSFDHARRKFFGRKAVASAEDTRHVGNFAVGKSLSQCGDDVKVQRFAGRAGFFGSIQNIDNLCGFRQSFEERFFRERAIQADFNQADFVAVVVEIVDGFFYSFGAGAHDNDNLFGIGCTDIIDNVILAAGYLGKLVHFLLNNAFNFVVVGIGSFAALEEYVRILGGTADNRGFRAQSVFGVELHVYVFDHRFQVIIGKQFDFFDFVRSAETVKEVHERNA